MSKTTRLAIIGSGPSGYTAAIYASRAMLKPILFAGLESGGQLMWTSDVENFPGFKDGIAGPELMGTMRAQAERFGTQVIDDHITAIDFSARPFKMWTGLPDGVDMSVLKQGTPEEIAAVVAQVRQSEPAVVADAVIISTGATWIMLNVPGEKEFMGRGVSTCAVCDAAFFRDKATFVVGGGDSAMEDTLALTKFATSVTVIHRRDSFKASKIMQDRVINHPKVKVLWNSTIVEIKGEQKVMSLSISNTVDLSTQELPADGVFIAIGHRPATSLFHDVIVLDSVGYVVTRHSLSQLGLQAAADHINEKGLLEFPTMTSIAGVFAAGDVVDVRYKQAITAAGQGCEAALDAEKWLEDLE